MMKKRTADEAACRLSAAGCPAWCPANRRTNGMAFLLGCEKARVEFPTKTVFEDVSLGLTRATNRQSSARTATGNPRCFLYLQALSMPDEGRVIRTRGVRVGVLGQADVLSDDDTVEHAVVGDTPEYEWAGRCPRPRHHLRACCRYPLAGARGRPVGRRSRRVDLARLLIGDWDVLMLDEPTNHLGHGAPSPGSRIT